MTSVGPLALATALFLPLLAHAVDPTPGEYSVGGVQNICLQSGGTWYGTTFAGWGGKWENTGAKTFVYGNYAAGAGNDAMFLKNGKRSGVWQEWRDDLSSTVVLKGISLSKMSDSCSPPAARSARGAAHPMQ